MKLISQLSHRDSKMPRCDLDIVCDGYRWLGTCAVMFNPFGDSNLVALQLFRHIGPGDEGPPNWSDGRSDVVECVDRGHPTQARS